MNTVLICVRGFRINAVLDGLRKRLHPSMRWIVLHVVDSGPTDDLDHSRGQLPDSGDRRPQVHDRQAETSHDLHLQVRAEVEEWLASHGRRAEIVMAEGRPEQEILRIAHDRNVALIAIGDLTSPGPRRLPPVAQFVVDHASCDVLLVR
jgi:nucleotide-binding universal stress UspA family protein